MGESPFRTRKPTELGGTMLRKHTQRRITLAVGIATAICLQSTAWAQDIGNITGSISAEGIGLVGIAVTIQGASNQSTTTNGAGVFSFSGIPAGEHSLAADLGADHFLPDPDVKVSVLAGQTTSVDLQARGTPTVKVTVNPDTTLTVTPNPLRIFPGQPIRWQYEEGGALTVHFNPLSPLLYRRKMEQEGVIEAQVRRDILPGKYSYFVAVLWRGIIVTEDPELIDENGDDRRPGGGET